MNKKIGITAWGGVSALGVARKAVEEAYSDPRSYLQQDGELGEWCARLPYTPEPKGALGQKKRLPEQLDRSVLLAWLAADQFWDELNWGKEEPIGINIGSSRGATALWEQYHRQFLQAGYNGLSPLASPTTTLGNISSWMGAYLGLDGPGISHSVTCSSALQAIVNGMAWLESGRCRRFLVGGSEAPLTPFTMAQMKALRIYAAPDTRDYPCRSLDPSSGSNTMVLGEGAALFALEADANNALAWIAGAGYAQEMPATPTSVSRDGEALQRAMRQALEAFGSRDVDVVLCHAPGTLQGDAAERRAIRAVFGMDEPLLSGNKWKLGHTLGASGALSLEMALLMLQRGQVYEIPYLVPARQGAKAVKTIMINAMGFGGNAVSLIISKKTNL